MWKVLTKEGETIKSQETSNGLQVIGEAKSAMDDMIGLQQDNNDADKLNLEERVAKLNVNQKKNLQQYKNHLMHQVSWTWRMYVMILNHRHYKWSWRNW